MNEEIIGWIIFTLLIISFLCCTLLSTIFFNLGSRFILFSWLSWSHSCTYLLKIYLLLSCLLRLKSNVNGGWIIFNGIMILINNFFVVAYNMSLLLTCIHIYLTVIRGSKYASWPNAQSFHISLSIAAAFIQAFHTTTIIYRHNRAIIPFLWVNLIVLTMLLVSGPIMLGHLSLKFCKCRERALDLLKKSAISRALCYRFLFGLFGIISITAHGFYRLLTGNKTSEHDSRFDPFDPFKSRVSVLSARYASSAFSGIILFIIFVTTTESWIMFKLFLRRTKQFLSKWKKLFGLNSNDDDKKKRNKEEKDKMHLRNSSTIPIITVPVCSSNLVIVDMTEKARSNSAPTTLSELQFSNRENDITQFI